MNKIEVLIADDHTLVRQGLKQIMGETGDIVVAGEAATGHEVLALTRQRDWDVLILDLSMPGRNGLDLIRQIHDEKPGLPILVLSMHSEEQYAMRALRSGASGYLTKECDSDVLIGALRKLATGGVYASSRLSEQMVRERRPSTAQLPHTLLSEREYQIFLMIVEGQGLTRIADVLSLSVKTISTHKSRILRKFSMTNQTELIRYAIAHRLAEASEI